MTEGPVRKITAAEARELTKSVYMDRNETAAYLGVSAKLLASHTHDGPYYHKFWGKVLYKLADVEQWAKQQKVPQERFRHSSWLR